MSYLSRYLAGEYELVWDELVALGASVRRRMPVGLFDPITATKPAIPFEEYDRQMETILGVIVARTGLPLYDLR